MENPYFPITLTAIPGIFKWSSLSENHAKMPPAMKSIEGALLNSISAPSGAMQETAAVKTKDTAPRAIKGLKKRLETGLVQKYPNTNTDSQPHRTVTKLNWIPASGSQESAPFMTKVRKTNDVRRRSDMFCTMTLKKGAVR